jgi:hypothetical protein
MSFLPRWQNLKPSTERTPQGIAAEINNMFQDISEKDFAVLSDSDELRDGGAALTAYARMQFEEMSEY